jgi:hypothetical protein
LCSALRASPSSIALVELELRGRDGPDLYQPAIEAVAATRVADSLRVLVANNQGGSIANCSLAPLRGHLRQLRKLVVDGLDCDPAGVVLPELQRLDVGQDAAAFAAWLDATTCPRLTQLTLDGPNCAPTGVLPELRDLTVGAGRRANPAGMARRHNVPTPHEPGDRRCELRADRSAPRAARPHSRAGRGGWVRGLARRDDVSAPHRPHHESTTSNAA